ncbi:MAG: hypothetical protein U0169_13970 [Polyangiaceae bacterium]
MVRAWQTTLLLAAMTSARTADAEVVKVGDTKAPFATAMATTLVGTGLRFNNPYRLATPLGTTAESVSRTATYVDVGLGLTFGAPRGFQHGATFRWSFSTEGVAERVIVPSYLLYRRWRDWAAYGRAGIPIVLAPTRTFGVEGSLAAVWFFRGGIGVVGEVVGSLVYGAGTREVEKPAYPVLSGQLGLLFAYEVMP